MELGEVQLATVGRIREVPNLEQLLALKSALAKELARDVATDPACVFRVPRTEDVVVALALLLAHRPWDLVLGRPRGLHRLQL